MSDENKAADAAAKAKDAAKKSASTRGTTTARRVKAPNKSGGRGFLWAVAAIGLIAAVVIGLFAWQGIQKASIAENMPQQDVNFNVAVKDNTVEIAAPNVDPKAPVVEIYEDFSCPHCADLTKADHEDVRKAVDEGKLKVQYKFLTFLDDGNKGPSTRAAGVILAVAETGNAKAFWNLHDYFMLEQRTVARTWGDKDFGKAAKAYGLDSSVVNAIKDGQTMDRGQAVGNANYEELQKRYGKVSSPVVYANGKLVEIKMGEGGMPKSWVPEVLAQK